MENALKIGDKFKFKGKTYNILKSNKEGKVYIKAYRGRRGRNLTPIQALEMFGINISLEEEHPETHIEKPEKQQVSEPIVKIEKQTETPKKEKNEKKSEEIEFKQVNVPKLKSISENKLFSMNFENKGQWFNIGKPVQDIRDGNRYEVEKLSKEGIDLKHIPNFRHLKRNDIFVEYDEFLELFQKGYLKVSGFDNEKDYNSLGRILKDILRDVQIEKVEVDTVNHEAEKERLKREIDRLQRDVQVYRSRLSKFVKSMRDKDLTIKEKEKANEEIQTANNNIKKMIEQQKRLRNEFKS